MEERCVLKQVCICLTVVVVVLVFLGIFPELEIGGWKLNRVKVFSDLMVEEAGQMSMETASARIPSDTLEADSLMIIGPEALAQKKDSVTLIEDFTEGNKGLVRLNQALASGQQNKRPIRIAFLGDSYIEADIITAHVRECLQQRYGGRGVGFVPVSSPAAGYRQSVEHKAEGWTSYTMVYYNKADWNRLMVSGEYFVPEEGAVMSVKGRGEGRKAHFGEARFFFQNTGHSHVKINVDGRDSVFLPPAEDSLLQQICLKGDLNHLQFSFTKVEGFTGYGVWLNDPTGIYVDNFAVRGSSGIVLSIMNRELMEQLARYVSYDLVVLEFGLNVVMPEEKIYTAYKKQMLKTIQHLQQCFPGADFLLMSVGDRGYRRDGKVITPLGVPALVLEQRDLAKQAGILFWNTYQAMGGKGSMVKFVENQPPLANKDYTHINHLGGKRIASEMVKALDVEFGNRGRKELQAR